MSTVGFRSNERYPAPGSRYRDNGALYGVGDGGYSWSSLVDGGKAHYLDFHNARVASQNSSSRAFARQVRCLLE